MGNRIESRTPNEKGICPEAAAPGPGTAPGVARGGETVAGLALSWTAPIFKRLRNYWPQSRPLPREGWL